MRLIVRGDTDLEYRAYLVVLSIERRFNPDFVDIDKFLRDQQYQARIDRKELGRLKYLASQRKAATVISSDLERDIQEVRDSLIIPYRPGSNQQKRIRLS